MKIAVCISGQLRTWKECFPTWNVIFNAIRKNPKFSGEEIEIDYFIHTWDLHTISPHIWNKYEDEFSPVTVMNIRIPISTDEINEVIDTIKPKKYIVDDLQVNNSRANKNNNLGYKYDNEISLLYWTAPHLYSVMRCGQLKLDYEIENNFEYDVCFKIRFDLKFNEWDAEQINDEITLSLREKTIYSVHSNKSELFPYFIVGDIFYMSDSQTFNILSTFYNWLPVLRYKTFFHGISVEHIFAYYARMFNIDNERMKVDPKVIRLDYNREFIREQIRLI